jgi:hypothetical protein
MKKLRKSTLIVVLAGLIVVLGGLNSAGVLDKPLHPEVVDLLKQDWQEAPPDATYKLIQQLADSPESATLRDSYTSCTSRTQLGCLSVLRQDILENPIDQNPEIARQLPLYLDIIQSDSFQGDADSTESGQVIPWGTLLQLDNLYLAHQSALGSAAFLSALTSSSQFWQMLFGAGDTVLAKMVAVAGLWNNAQYVSQYLATGTMKDTELAQLAAILAAMPVDPAQLTNAIHREFVTFAAILAPFDGARVQALYGVDPWISALGLQPQATINAYYQQAVVPSICLAMLTRSQIVTGADACTREEQIHGSLS